MGIPNPKKLEGLTMSKTKAVISLFDYTGVLSKPYLDSGLYTVLQFDQQLENNWTPHLTKGSNRGWLPATVGGDYREWTPIIESIYDQYDVAIILSQPPCTDLAVSGAAHMAKKRLANPDYEAEAMDMVLLAKRIADEHGTPYAIENPVSRISTLWRKPDLLYHPYEYGGWLPEDDTPPNHVTPARDCYTKKTCQWTGNGFIEPVRRPVSLPEGYRYSPQFNLLGGSSLRTKNLRSACPRGWAIALFEANHQPVKQPVLI